MISIEKDKRIKLQKVGSWPETYHIFDEDSIWAIKAAIASERPLLVRGEPGTGKSQLARAAAQVMNRAFISDVVHSRSESQDLQWHFDAVSRLGEAQVLGVNRNSVNTDPLNYLNFLTPGSLWWTFNWKSAEKQYLRCKTTTVKPEKPPGWSPEKGCVLLIDEIDKAEADLPNGLLETLGNGAFTVPYLSEPIRFVKGAPPPLVVITTNEERELPAAFLRRCLVLHLSLPENTSDLIEWLVKRGRVHFKYKCSKEVLVEAATQLSKDRLEAINIGLVAPGQAEYLDIIRAVCSLAKTKEKQMNALIRIRNFAFKKSLHKE